MNQNNNTPTSIFEKNIHPYHQAIGVVSVGVLLFILSAFMKQMGVGMSERFPWMVAGASMFLYSIFNSLLSLSAHSPMKYWGQSITGYFAVAISTSLIAWLISGLSIYEAGSFKWIYTVITIGYLIFLSMMNIIKKIVNFAQNEEWNSPRIRISNRKKRKKKD